MPMTMEQRWSTVVQGTGTGARVKRKLTANQWRNWLLGLACHACRKSLQGAPLSDLESKIVRTLGTATRGEYLIKCLAHVYTATPLEMRKQMFSPKFSDLKPTDSITEADLGRLAPDIVREMKAQPHFRDIDVDAIHRGDMKKRDAIRVPSEAIARYGGTIMRLVSKEPQK